MDKSGDLTGYFRRLRHALNCPRAARRAFLADARRMADDFRQGKPDATAQEVERFLGDPYELSQSFLENLDSDKLTRYRAVRQRNRRVLIALSILIFLLMGALLVRTLTHHRTISVESTLIIYAEEDQS